MGIPVPGLIEGAPGIPAPGMAPPGGIPGTELVGAIPGTPPGTALVGAMPGTPPGTAGIVPTPPGIAPGTIEGGVLVAPGIPGTPADNPCSREKNAMPQQRVFFKSGLSLAYCNHRPFNN